MVKIIKKTTLVIDCSIVKENEKTKELSIPEFYDKESHFGHDSCSRYGNRNGRYCPNFQSSEKRKNCHELLEAKIKVYNSEIATKQ